MAEQAEKINTDHGKTKQRSGGGNPELSLVKSAGTKEDGVDEQVFQDEAMVHINALYGVALKLTYNEEDAEDLVQETYLRAYRFFHTYKPGTNCRAWLYRIMKNLFVNDYRKKKKKKEDYSFDDVEEIFESKVADSILSGKLGNPESALINTLVDEKVIEAIEKVPRCYRMPVLLSDMEGYTYKEIARILDCPIGTVMSRIYRGRKILQRYLIKHAEDMGVLN